MSSGNAAAHPAVTTEVGPGDVTRLVTVLVNRGCPHCLRAIDRVTALAERCGAHVAAVDVATHGAVAEGFAVKASPVVVFKGRIAHAGVPDASTFTALASGDWLPDRDSTNEEMIV